MRILKCKNCDGTMVLSVSGTEALCNFCGSRILLDHEDTDYYRDFYKRMNEFFAAPKNEQERKQKAEKLWEHARTKEFTCTDGTPVNVKYMYTYSDKDADVYVARRNIIFHFKADGAAKTELMRKNISMLDYPSADTRHLEECFPKISGGFTLDDGSHICVISKHEDEYPLRLFGALHGRHVAWIVSRLENICCVLQFSSIVHPQINTDTIYINPYTHQAALYGNWWTGGKQNSYSYDKRTMLSLRQNLTGLRNTAANALGYADTAHVCKTQDIPKPFVEFLQSLPCATAYDDFAFWDDMMLRAYGERKFFAMETNDEDIYRKKG